MIETYFKVGQKAIDELQVELDSASSALESYIEEHSGEDGLLENAKTEKGTITKTSVTQALKEVTDSEEKEVMQKCKALLESEAKAKKALKTAIDTLNIEVFKKYPTLNIEEVKELVIVHKWYASWHSDIDAEIQRVTYGLAHRVKSLEERYSQDLKSIDADVKKYEAKVEKHLKAMGLSW